VIEMVNALVDVKVNSGDKDVRRLAQAHVRNRLLEKVVIMKLEYVIVVLMELMEMHVKVDVLVIAKRVYYIVNVLDKESVITARMDLNLAVDEGIKIKVIDY